MGASTVPRKPDSPTAGGTLGTFAGVFTPSILTILGIILFLRLGYVVGSAGLGRALIIIGLANAISVLTSISLSAIATNIKVRGGGDYYLISRTLGVEFGGSIGIVLFLAQSVSVGFYCIGFGEAVTSFIPDAGRLLPQIIAGLAVSFLFVFAWLGADWATKFQFLVMATLVTALISFFAGGLARWDTVILVQNWVTPPAGAEFWVLFAIFFPAVTGFTQGVSMSGDLKDAGKSLPSGTFLAVGLSIIVYFGVALVFAATLPNELLIGDYGAMKRVARFTYLIDAGVIAATLSSAMASFMGAPRILQSLAADRTFTFLLPFAKGSGPTGNPRRGILLSGVIALVTITLGNLNLVASVVSMFFLISYGLLNYATFYEARAASPSFRPRFRFFDLRLSFLGGLACLGAMLAIDLAAGAAATALLFAIYQYLKRTAGPARWADSRRSYYLQRVRENLLAAGLEPEHPRDWRPHLLAFSNDSHRRKQLLRFASWLEGGSGFTTAVRILEGEGVKMLKLRQEAEEELRADIADYGMQAFPLVVAAPNLNLGVHTLVQSFGIGPLRVNTILLNWLEQLPKGILGLGEFQYATNLRTAFRLGCNIVVLDAKEEEWVSLETLSPNERRIDVWWWDDATGRLMLLLAYLMTRSDAWGEAKIRVLAAGQDGALDEELESLKKILEEARIEAEPEIVENMSSETVVKHSADAALVFFPFRLRGDQLLDPFDKPLDATLPRLPIVALVLAAEDIELDAEPEEGIAGEIAAALDTLADAERKTRETEKEAVAAKEESEKWLREVRAATESGAKQEELSKIEAAALEAEERASKATRRAAKAMAKLEDAARTVEALGVKPPEGDKEPGEKQEWSVVGPS